MPADLIVTNARAFTADPAQPRAGAVAVRGGTIAFVGSAADAEAWRGPATRVIDAGGATLMPGFIDSHYHLLHGSLKLDGAQLGAVDDQDALASAIRSYDADRPGEPLVAGYGLRYAVSPDHRPLTRQRLDAIVGDRPLLLFAFDGHTAWANTRALELGGILRGGECGPNSEIVMAPDGTASGELREPGAFERLRTLLPVPDGARRRALLREGLAQAASFGITSIHNMDGNAGQLALYRALDDAGELTLRVYVPLSVTPETEPGALAEAVAMREGGSLARGGCVKLFMDGVIETGTGLLLEEYADIAGSRGEANYSLEHFTALATEADRLGLQIFVHAIGDAAVRRTLDGFEAARRANGPREGRHRVEHVELVHAADVPRFAELGAIASMQPYHAPEPPDYGPVWMSRVGSARWPWSFAWGRLRAAGARLVFGSDWPVVSQNPLLGVAAAVCRRPYTADEPPQALALADALLAYTRDAAYAEFEEGRKGVLRAGMAADLALLDRDLFAVPPEEIPEVRVKLTVGDGRIVYEG